MTSFVELTTSRRLLALVVTLATFVASACGTNHDAALAVSQAVTPLLAKHGVIDFIRTDECEFIAYERGAFATDPDMEACELHIDMPGHRRPIDAEARQLLDQIYRVAEAVGPRLTSATVTLVDGQVASGTFDFDVDTYWFEPGYTAMEDDDWFCETKAVNAAWYVWDC